jgi:hypothetical protein
VRRATVYRHFPDERSLFIGCSGLWRERFPVPDPNTWAHIADPATRLTAALDAIYSWYEDTEPMLTTLIRDMDAVPIVAELQQGRLEYVAAVEDMLAQGWGVTGKAATRLRAALALALDFFTWRTLHERGLARADAIAVASAGVHAGTHTKVRLTP